MVLRFAFSVVLGLLTLAACGPAPQTAEPEEAQPGADIIWDEYGVAHIYADDDLNGFYAYGWAQMHAHGSRILELYGRARGRAAEYWGEPGLQADIVTRRLGFPALSAEWWAAMPADQQAKVTAFVRGMNAYAAAHPDQLSPAMQLVLPIEETDPLAHLYQIVHRAFMGWGSLETALSLSDPDEGGRPGSNAYAIAPSRSASGNAMLVINPHLPWGDLFTWFEGQLEIPSQSIYGVSLIGIPMVGIGFNEYGGWTHTVNEYDGVDIYELTLKEGGYVFDGEILPFETSTETYAVKQADGSLKTQELVIQKSVHGPLLSQTDEKAYAVRFSGLESFGMLQQYWDMAAAKNLSEFEAAQKQLQMPFFNTFYANSEGDIYYLHGGALPNRKKGDHEFWSGLIPGDRSEFLWQGTLGYDALPQFSNPAAGFIQNANEPPWYTTFPPVLKSEDYLPFVASREEAWFRPQHSMRQVIEDTSITFEELVEMKQSTQLELADRILPELLEAAASSTTPIVVEARDILANWDRQANADSRGAVLFIAWAEYFFEQEEGNPLFATPWDEDNPYTTPDGLANTEMAVALLEKAATQIKATHGTLDIAYGDAYRLRRGDVDMPASGGPSFVGAYKIAEGRMGEDGITTISSGNTFSAVVEFGTPLKAVGSLPYGTSSQEASPHISDQLSLFSKNEMRPIWFYEEDVEENAMRTETLLAE